MRAKKINQVRELLNGKDTDQQETPKFFTNGKGAMYKGKHYAEPSELKEDYPKVVCISFTKN